MLKMEINRPGTLPDIIKEYIRNLINQGIIKDGDRLPPEEEIARKNNISRSTVRTALVEFAHEGLLKRYARRGTFVYLKTFQPTIRIGVFSPLLPMTREETDPYRTELWGGIQEEMLATGASLHFCQSIPEKSEQIVSAFGGAIDGLLFLVPLRKQRTILTTIQKLGVPLLVIGASPNKNINYLGVDNCKGITDAVKYLYQNGHRKLGAIFPSLDYFDHFERYNAFVSALKNLGLTCCKEWIKVIPEISSRQWIEDAKQATEELFKERSVPTALLCSGGFITIGAKEGLKRLQINIPDDLSFIGFDDIYLAEYMDPPLTTISQPVWEMGQNAVKILAALVSNKITQPFHRTYPTTLIVRKSVRNISK
jgi:DNA-binding LacI/PurR family transcriptional regulator